MATLLLLFRENFDAICEIVLSLEHEAGLGGPCACGAGILDTRCAECFPSTLKCRQCFINEHQNNPFHWAEVWNSRFFERKDFSELGGTVHLGHGGAPCPGRSLDLNSRSKMCVTHTNGVHITSVVYCNCPRAEDAWKQLLRCRIFPATLSRPYYTFTVAFLRLSHALALNAHSSAYKLAKTFRRLTDDAFYHNLPVSLAIQSVSNLRL